MASRLQGGKKTRSIEKTDSLGLKFLALEKRFQDDMEVAQIDLITDLDADFFNTSYELVQALVLANNFVAGKIKRYVDILARIHTRYVHEVNTNADLQQKVTEAEQRLRLAIETTADSTEIMERMKESLADAWRTADAVELREGNVQIVQEDVFMTKRSVDISPAHNPETMRIRGIVFRERDRLARELTEYQKRLETNRFYSQSLEGLIEDHRNTINKQQISVKNNEAEVFRLENKFRITTEALEEKIISQRKELDSALQTNQDLRFMEKQNQETMIINENLKQQLDRHTHENFALQKINRQLEEEKHVSKTLQKNLENTIKAVRRERDDMEGRYRATEREIKKKSELNTLLNRRFMLLAKKNGELAEQELLTANELAVVERKLATTASKLDESVLQKAEVERGREKLRVEIVNLNDGMASLRHDIVVQRNRMQVLQTDLDRVHVELDDVEGRVHKLNREKNELFAETNALSKNIETLEDSVAKKTERIGILQERLQQKHQDYLNAKKQMEIVHTEKTMLQKSLEVCGRDRQSAMNINTKLSFQITQLCNQLAMNEKDIIMHKNQIDQMESLLKHKQNEIHSKERSIKRLRTDLYDNKMRNAQLQHTIEEDEKRFKQLSCSLDEVRKEKSLEGQQMVRRNGEVRFQREKLAMMQLALDRGTTQYNQRVEDIRLLKTEISNLRQSNECMQRGIVSTANMRHEVVRLERQLVRERLQVTAFSEEMKHPYRIHRWRVVRGKDPQKYELIRKVQLLLKRNIRLSAQRSNLELKLQEVQQRYDALKKQLDYMPDPSVKHSLWLQQRKNQQQQRKLRAIKAELTINEIDLKSKDSIIKQYEEALKEQQGSGNSSLTLKYTKSKFTEHIFQMTSSSEIGQKNPESCSF